MLCVYKPQSTISGNLKDYGLGVRGWAWVGFRLVSIILGLYLFFFSSSPILFNPLGNTIRAYVNYVKNICQYRIGYFFDKMHFTCHWVDLGCV